MNDTSAKIISLIDGIYSYSVHENEQLDSIHIYLSEFELVIHTGLFCYNDIVTTGKTYNGIDLNRLNRQFNLLKFIATDDNAIEIHASLPDSLLKSAIASCENSYALKAVGMVFFELIQRFELAVKWLNDNTNS